MLHYRYLRKGALIIFILACTIEAAFSQRFSQPGYALKSHETLEISKIEMNNENTFVFLSIENRIPGGYFCADKNIVLSDPMGVKFNLIRADGIPVCPDTYKFKKPGEKLSFTLIFPKLKDGTAWIDIIEECSDNCFSFYGVSLDNELNGKIDEAVRLAENGETGKSIAGYKSILAEISGKNHGIEGAMYSDIIIQLMKSGRTVEAREWYEKMISSKSPRLEMHIKNLNSRGIFF